MIHQYPVYEASKSSKELKHIGWARDMQCAIRIASAFGHSRVNAKHGFVGSLGEGFAVYPQAASVEV